MPSLLRFIMAGITLDISGSKLSDKSDSLLYFEEEE